MCSENRKVGILAENYFVDACGTRGVNDCVSDVALDATAVCHNQAAAFLDTHTKRFKD